MNKDAVIKVEGKVPAGVNIEQVNRVLVDAFLEHQAAHGCDFAFFKHLRDKDGQPIPRLYGGAVFDLSAERGEDVIKVFFYQTKEDYDRAAAKFKAYGK